MAKTLEETVNNMDRNVQIATTTLKDIFYLVEHHVHSSKDRYALNPQEYSKILEDYKS